MAHRVLSLALLTLMASAAVVDAQTPETKPAPSKPVVASTKPATAKVSAAEKAKIEQQRALALSLLISLSNDARSYPDQKLRARTLSRIADALWEADAEQGRALFRKAWDAAAVADQESARAQEEDRKRQEAATGSFAIAAPPELRSEVLRLAARRDRTLGEEFLEKLTEARKQETADAAQPDPFESPAALRHRLRLANQLLEADVERAIQFADPGLTTVSMEGLSFLSNLRGKNPEAADQRYARFLAMAARDIKSDANTISLLASYLFTPHLFVTFMPSGGQQSSQFNRGSAPPQVSPELRAAFFSSAASVLLRPSPSKEQDRSSSGSVGKYLVIKRLLPLFEQHAPKPMTDQLKSEMASLSQTTDRDVLEDSDDDDEGVSRGIAPERKTEDLEKALLDRIERAKTSEERDSIYLQLATRTAEKGDMRARDFNDKIEDSELRKQAKPYVDMTLAFRFVDKKDSEKALNLAAIGEFSHVQKVWLLTQVAKQLATSNHDKAMEIVSEAAVEARRIGGSDPDRARALVAVANAYQELEKARAWETMLDVVKASNSAEGFNGEDGRITIRLQTKTMTSLQTNSVDSFNLPGVFRSLAQDNATQAIEIARSFEGEAPRATALIAVARQLLSDKR